jgi:hypothetical protein
VHDGVHALAEHRSRRIAALPVLTPEV